MPHNRSIMLSLGGFHFAANTAAFEQLREAVDYGWEVVRRAGQHPLLQSASPGEHTIEIEGVVFPLYAGYGSLDQLKTLAAQRQPLRMVAGTTKGKNLLGAWVIKQFARTDDLYIKGGQEQRQRFRLSLSYYGAKASG